MWGYHPWLLPELELGGLSRNLRRAGRSCRLGPHGALRPPRAFHIRFQGSAGKLSDFQTASRWLQGPLPGCPSWLTSVHPRPDPHLTGSGWPFNLSVLTQTDPASRLSVSGPWVQLPFECASLNSAGRSARTSCIVVGTQNATD